MARFQVILDKTTRQKVAQLPWQAETLIVTNPNPLRVYMRQGSNEYPDRTNYDYLFPGESKSQESVDSNLYGLTIGEPDTLAAEFTDRTVVQFLRGEAPSSFGAMPIKSIAVNTSLEISELPPITIAPGQQVQLPSGQIVAISDLPDVSLVPGQQVFLPAGTIVDVGVLPDVSIAPGQQILVDGSIVDVGDLPDVSIAPGQQIALPSGQVINVGNTPVVLPPSSQDAATLIAIAGVGNPIDGLAQDVFVNYQPLDIANYGGVLVYVGNITTCALELQFRVSANNIQYSLALLTVSIPALSTRTFSMPKFVRYIGVRIYNRGPGTINAANLTLYARGITSDFIGTPGKDIMTQPMQLTEISGTPNVAVTGTPNVAVTNKPTILTPANDVLANVIPLTTVPSLASGGGAYLTAAIDLLTYGGVLLAVLNGSTTHECTVTIQTWDGIRGAGTPFKTYYVRFGSNMPLIFPRVERYMLIQFRNDEAAGNLTGVQFHVRGIAAELTELEGSVIGDSQKIVTYTFSGSHGTANTWDRSWTEALPSSLLPNGYELLGYMIAVGTTSVVDIRLGGDAAGSDVFRLLKANMAANTNTGWMIPSPAQYGGIVIDGSTNRLWYKTSIANTVVTATLALRRRPL